MEKKRILLIDDDKEICSELKEILEDEGYLVDFEYDGLKGLNKFFNNKYDLVIQDLKLPGINGIELLVRIKEFKKEQKVIVLTGRPIKSDFLNENEEFKKEEAILFSKANAVYNKPFNIVELLKKIEEFF